jgi:hypothetical protein
MALTEVGSAQMSPKLHPREEQFRIPSPRRGLSLFLRYATEPGNRARCARRRKPGPRRGLRWDEFDQQIGGPRRNPNEMHHQHAMVPEKEHG